MSLIKKVSIVLWAVEARRAKMLPNARGIVGMTGRAESEISPEGTVFVRGELWRARSRSTIAYGESVSVIGITDLTLDVRPSNTARHSTYQAKDVSRLLTRL